MTGYRCRYRMATDTRDSLLLSATLLYLFLIHAPLSLHSFFLIFPSSFLFPFLPPSFPQVLRFQAPLKTGDVNRAKEIKKGVGGKGQNLA